MRALVIEACDIGLALHSPHFLSPLVDPSGLEPESPQTMKPEVFFPCTMGPAPPLELAQLSLEHLGQLRLEHLLEALFEPSLDEPIE